MKRIDAAILFLILEGAVSLVFTAIFTASSIYQVTIADLNPLQLILVGTILEASVFLFEVPTGVVADVYSRRLSIIIGYILIGTGFLLEGSVPLFIPILLAQVLWGVGYTFTSGATQAWITDEIGEQAANRLFLRGKQISQLTALLGIGAGVVLGSLHINFPIQIGGLTLTLFGVFLALVMPETGFRPIPKGDRNSWQHVAYTFREGLKMIRRRPALMDILIIGLFFGLYSEGFDRLWTKHLLDNFNFFNIINIQPVVWFGMLRAIGMLLSVFATQLVIKRVDSVGNQRLVTTLMLSTILLTISLLLFAQSRILFLALVAYWAIYISRNLIEPLYTAWVNQSLDRGVRATVISMSSQVDAIGQIISGPAIGLVANLFSISIAISISALTLTPVLPLFARARRHEQNHSILFDSPRSN